jgi:hypothetical protein
MHFRSSFPRRLAYSCLIRTIPASPRSHERDREPFIDENLNQESHGATVAAETFIDGFLPSTAHPALRATS